MRIKNKRAVGMLALAVMFGLVAVALASRWLLDQSAAGSNRIVVAASDVNIGQRLTSDMLAMAEWPVASRPQGAFADASKLTGRVLKTSILRGEPLSEAKLAPGGTVGGLSALITEGKRALTVRVNDVIGVAGFALPGNYVDIIVSTQRDPAPNEPNLREQSISKIVLERILVLAVAQEVSRDETKPRVVNAVTLEVSPDQAEKLDLARSVGTLSLALRNQVDPQDVNTGGATKRTLLGEVLPPAPPPAPAAAARPAPVIAKAPVVRKVVAEVRRDCVGVLNGVNASQECF
jgi:pilus assembly protein CpaB